MFVVASIHSGTLISGAILIVLAVVTLLFPRQVAQNSANLEQRRRNFAPQPFKRLYPQWDQQRYVKLNTFIAVFLLVLGVLAVAISL